MSKKQFYNISYPFTNNGSENYFIDLNDDLKGKVRSILMHVVFTPKGQKLRDPEFGTDLIKYIFEPDDGITFEAVKNEVSEVVSKYLKGVTIKNISVVSSEDDFREIYVRLDYSVSNGIDIVDDSFVTKI